MDKQTTIETFVRTNILYRIKSKFLQRLCKSDNDRTIETRNAHIMYDIIKSLPDKIQYFNLDVAHCYDLLDIEIDIELLQTYATKNNFQELDNILVVIGYNKETIIFIMKHLPEDYDLNNFTQNSLIKMYRLSNNELLKQKIKCKLGTYTSFY